MGPVLTTIEGVTIAIIGVSQVAELASSWVATGTRPGEANAIYSDFDPDSGEWPSPGSITDAEFAKIRALIGDFVTETQRQIDEFTRYRAAGHAQVGP